jgi:hypothetical protein
MIRVTVEIVPFGIEEDAEKIATMLIANNGNGNYEFGDYDFSYNYIKNPEPPTTGSFKGFPRRLGAWSLVKAVLSVDEKLSTEVTRILCDKLKEYKENGY